MTSVEAVDATPKRTGSIDVPKDRRGKRRRWPSGHLRYYGRVSWPDGTRPRVTVPERCCYSEERAKEYVASVQEDVDARRDELLRAEIAADGATSETEKWFADWIASKKARGQTSTGDRLGHWKHHITPVLEGKHVRDWTAEDLRRLVASLDAEIARSELAPKSAKNIWGTATKICADATKSKVESLRVRSDNPARDVEGPDRGNDRGKQFLYPSEFLQLVSCAGVPLRWRRAAALTVYLYPRAGELRALRWEDVDLAHGTVHVHQSFERRSRVVKPTKTKTSRRFSIEPTLLPLLKAMHAEAGGTGLVCPLPNRMASRLREWLTRAGVQRNELHVESPTTRPLMFHDLRATGITWMAVRGDEPLKIKQRAGHNEFSTTEGYIRTAEALRDGFGDLFPPLPAELLVAPVSPESAKVRSVRGKPVSTRHVHTQAKLAQPLSGTRDSNPLSGVASSHIAESSRVSSTGRASSNERASSPNSANARRVDVGVDDDDVDDLEQLLTDAEWLTPRLTGRERRVADRLRERAERLLARAEARRGTAPVVNIDEAKRRARREP